MGARSVSVLIRTYNSGDLIERCLGAVHDAHGVDEVLVLDGGSDDGTPERAEALGASVHRMPGTGPSTRINVGVRLAEHDLVLLLDDDAFVDPETPARMAEALAERPELGAVGAALRAGDGSEARSTRPCKTLSGVTLDAMGLRRFAFRDRAAARRLAPDGIVWNVTWVPLCSSMVRRQAFNDVGGIDERFTFYGADDDFAHGLLDHGWQLAVRRDAGAVHLGSASTAARHPARWYPVYQQEQFRYLQKYYPYTWRSYEVVWLLRASLHATVWAVRARRSHDAEARAEAQEWADAFRLARRPHEDPLRR
jgi:GT2 family glycosyltransferase